MDFIANFETATIMKIFRETPNLIKSDKKFGHLT